MRLLGSSQAELVRNWCAAVRRLSPPPKLGEATHVQKLCMQFGWGRAKLEEGYACAEMMHTVWSRSSHAEHVLSICELRCDSEDM